jgi:hypothetical protein
LEKNNRGKISMKIVADSNGHICSAQGFIPVISSLGKDILGIEIGISSGRNAAYFLQECSNIKKIYGVDPYLPFKDWDIFVTQELQDSIFKIMKEHLEEYEERFELFKMKSQDAANLFENEFYDYVFVDGDHSYEVTKIDCELYYSKVKVGKIFSGHDWQLDSVKNAVLEFRLENNINNPINFTHNSVWYWFK